MRCDTSRGSDRKGSVLLLRGEDIPVVARERPERFVVLVRVPATPGDDGRLMCGVPGTVPGADMTPIENRVQ